MDLLVASVTADSLAVTGDDNSLASSSDYHADNLSVNISVGTNEGGDDEEGGVLSEEEMRRFMFKIYNKHPFESSRDVSRKQRLREGHSTATLAYSETPFDTFREQFLKLYQHGLSAEDAVRFIDIGCGSGGVVFAAALCHDFKECVGIEILSDLHAVCLDVQRAWVKGGRRIGAKQEIALSFLLGDALAIDLLGNPYGVVYCNLTCFNENMCAALFQQLFRMRAGTFVITASKPIDSPLYLLLEASAGAMSFGQATFYIHKRSDESYRCDMTDKDAVDMFMREKLYDE